jgi:hypothetical protein
MSKVAESKLKMYHLEALERIIQLGPSSIKELARDSRMVQIVYLLPKSVPLESVPLTEKATEQLVQHELLGPLLRADFLDSGFGKAGIVYSATASGSKCIQAFRNIPKRSLTAEELASFKEEQKKEGLDGLLELSLEKAKSFDKSSEVGIQIFRDTLVVLEQQGFPVDSDKDAEETIQRYHRLEWGREQRTKGNMSEPTDARKT